MIKLEICTKRDRLVSHYSFYSAFATPQEYRILHQDKSLGTLPTNIPMMANTLFIFGGKCWRALTVDDVQRVVEVEVSTTAQRLKFSGGAGQVCMTASGKKCFGSTAVMRFPPF